MNSMKNDSGEAREGRRGRRTDSVRRPRRQGPATMPMSEFQRIHKTVLLHEVVDWLRVEPSGTYVDMTVGAGGHAGALIERLGPEGTFIGFDADSQAIADAQKRFAHATPHITLVHANFRRLRQVLADNSIEQVHGIAFDLA